MKKEHDDALELQKKADLKRKQAEQERRVEKAKEEYIKAWDLIEIYESEQNLQQIAKRGHKT